MGGSGSDGGIGEYFARRPWAGLIAVAVIVAAGAYQWVRRRIVR